LEVQWPRIPAPTLKKKKKCGRARWPVALNHPILETDTRCQLLSLAQTQIATTIVVRAGWMGAKLAAVTNFFLCSFSFLISRRCSGERDEF
jgi:hypothetical protein